MQKLKQCMSSGKTSHSGKELGEFDNACGLQVHRGLAKLWGGARGRRATAATFRRKRYARSRAHWNG
eukprot:2936-Pleurochrysis_carterae.AAC.1